MPISIFDPADRLALVARLESLSPHSPRLWGTMDLPKAICHMGDQLRLALGEIVVEPVPGLASVPGFRTLIVRYLPFPKNVKTAPELLVTDLASLDEARSWLLTWVERVVAHGLEAPLAAHPLFGALSTADWGIVMARHMDHHLRQFDA